ncbi:MULTISPECIES: MarR family winged helix-turn-helix transcriptional regulator [unclassified Lebetimonas]|jgi:DNA-binding MarR family transcriptional regulator|uniref:MarR family winged helix-turn-helix transcriptional regulator n=1 Tax=unclassified Lebetimonas TaxID=2648158 RepID=UPI000463E754|nr:MULTISPECIES: MarR family transcriptional regulator [unclassified Lebetimonas]
MHFNIENSIALKLSNTLNSLRKAFNKEIKDFGISSEQYAFLKLISIKNLTPSEIADILNKDKAAITRFIIALEKKDLIKKENIDKRSYKLILKEKGRKILNKVDKKALEFRKKIEQNIPEEKIECLFKTLEKIEKIMKE